MKLKILTVGIMVLISNGVFVSAISSEHNDNSIETKSDNLESVNVRVALLRWHKESWYKPIFDGYQWVVGNKTYKFTTYDLYDKDILRGKLTIKDYDLLNIEPHEIKMVEHSLPSIRNKIWKTNIANFVKNGGGYIGYCGGTSIIIGMENKPKTFIDIIIDNTDLGISKVKRVSEFNTGNPPFFSGFYLLYQFSNNPETLKNEAYLYFGGQDPNNDSQLPSVPIDFDVNRNTPIFDDLHEGTRRILWAGGVYYIIPEEAKNDVTVLACYPEDALSENKSTQIHYWKYTGGLRGYVNGFFEAKKHGYQNETFLPTLPALVYARDWEMTDKIVQTNVAGKPFMTMETYPNDNQGRLILTYGHPELPVWWGGYIEDVPDTDKNNLLDGFYQWKNVTSWNETIEDELTYNWWIVRRQAAWVAKVPDNDLPPVYGPSQLSDVYPYEQPSCFTITGNAETTSVESEWLYHKESLDLYYRHSSNNETWSDWTLYGTDNDISNGWFWQFNASLANGPGYYQFYSLRHVRYENEWLNETAPPGPDAIAYIDNS